MKAIQIRKVSVTSKVRILGKTFDGLQHIRCATEASVRMGGTIIWNEKVMKPVSGIHVVRVYEPYPCFDSYDYASEDRDYSNFFFSTAPFTKEQIMELSRLAGGSNGQIVSEEMPAWATPAVYHDGSGNTMLVATRSQECVNGFKECKV